MDGGIGVGWGGHNSISLMVRQFCGSILDEYLDEHMSLAGNNWLINGINGGTFPTPSGPLLTTM